LYINSAESILTMTLTTIKGNNAHENGGGLYIFKSSPGTNNKNESIGALTISDSTSIIGNEAGDEGGGVYIDGNIAMSFGGYVGDNIAQFGGGMVPENE